MAARISQRDARGAQSHQNGAQSLQNSSKMEPKTIKMVPKPPKKSIKKRRKIGEHSVPLMTGKNKKKRPGSCDATLIPWTQQPIPQSTSPPINQSPVQARWRGWPKAIGYIYIYIHIYIERERVYSVQQHPII